MPETRLAVQVPRTMFNPDMRNDNQSQGLIKYRPRRRHQKSRNGCRECKRRRIKVGRIHLHYSYPNGDRTNHCHQCDEKRPCCTCCALNLESCDYPPAALLLDESDSTDEVYLPRTQSFTLSVSPMASSFLYNSILPKVTAYPTAALIKTSCCIEGEDHSLPPSDKALYHHYLQHTSHVSKHEKTDKMICEIIIPTLALQSKVVCHSILALSAACLCSDMIAKRPPPDIAIVKQVLMAGYRHCNIASEETRNLISQPKNLKPEPLLASAPLLIGFSTASQHINHWIESSKPTREHPKLLPESLIDTIIIMNGLKATTEGLFRNINTTTSSPKVAYESQIPNEIASTQLESNSRSTTLPPSHTHVMYPIFAATSQDAFCRLQERLDSTSLSYSDDTSLGACLGQFESLSAIRNLTFSSDAQSEPLAQNNLDMLQQLPRWIRSYIGRPVVLLPNEPLIRPFLMFLTQSSQQYLDLLLPLLDETLESPMMGDTDCLSELTEVQVLALDIWAHWCVLMFLVEEEAWWIGNLLFILLNRMLNRYGEHFVARFWPANRPGGGTWWPASMLTCLREVRRCL